ncbi:MAG: P-II family nitrogen regulator [Zetaproteobacteria bacterium]|nr:P-II family nitrogen regulator [Zetaproteobacteria bacterium]
MKTNAVIAIVRTDALEQVESCLQDLGIEGLSISQVKGYGEYENFYSQDHMTVHIRIEIFTAESKAEEVARCIMKAAHVGQPDDGIVTISPVHKFYRIRTQSEVAYHDNS